MPRYFIDAGTSYYEAITDIPTPEGSTSVPRRPASHWDWSGSAWVEGELPPPSVPQTISFPQFMTGAEAEGWITAAQAADWRRGDLPAEVVAGIDMLPATDLQKLAAKNRAARPSFIERDNFLVEMIRVARSLDPEDMDNFFRTYGAV